MSNQVLLSFDIDENKVIENAEKEAARQIVKQAFDDKGTYYTDPSALMRKYIKEILSEMLEEDKEEIIKQAVKEVVANLHKTKAVKEMLEKEGSK